MSAQAGPRGQKFGQKSRLVRGRLPRSVRTTPPDMAYDGDDPSGGRWFDPSRAPTEGTRWKRRVSLATVPPRHPGRATVLARIWRVEPCRRRRKRAGSAPRLSYQAFGFEIVPCSSFNVGGSSLASIKVS